MIEQFDKMILRTLASGTNSYHEVMPADFGEFDTRLAMLALCLKLVVDRFPGIYIQISGETASLINMGLEPDGNILVGKQIIRTTVGPTSQPGMVRLTFSQEPSK